MKKIAQQINFLLLPEDDLTLQNYLRARSIAVFSAQQSSPHASNLAKIDEGDSIKCLLPQLFIPYLQGKIIEGQHLYTFRHANSLFIELWLPKFDGEKLKRGRLYFEPNTAYQALSENDRLIFDDELADLWRWFKKTFKNSDDAEIKNFRIGKAASEWLKNGGVVVI